MISKLNLPADYDFVEPGETSITHECPWIVPEAIEFILKNIKKEWKVLEVGSGGSSIFFGRRCFKVTAIENFRSYYEKMQQALSSKKLSHQVDLQYVETDTMLEYLADLDDTYDVISIDHGVHHPSRSECLEAVIGKWTGEMFIFDNWSKKPAWPAHHKLTHNALKERHKVFSECDFFDFTHKKWAGSGTRIAINKEHIC